MFIVTNLNKFCHFSLLNLQRIIGAFLLITIVVFPSQAQNTNNGIKKIVIDPGHGGIDPGNLGTIIRLCDWFGVKQLLCSKETVDCFNPKVVQATMGSLTRVNVFYIDLNHYLEETKQPVFGAFMDGENVYASNLPADGILVLGNEANGISQSIEKHVNQRISIPRFGDLQETESLNVATAGAILLSEFRRSN